MYFNYIMNSENLNIFFDNLNDRLAKMEEQAIKHQELLIQNSVLTKQLTEYNNKLQNKIDIEEKKNIRQRQINNFNHKNFCVEYDLNPKTCLPMEE